MKKVIILVFAFLFINSVNAKEIIVLGVHGLGARAQWLSPLKDALAKEGIEFIAKDLPCFGLNNKENNPESKYTKGHIDSYKEWLDFVAQQINEIKSSKPDAKLIVYGHSLGGLIVANTPNITKSDKVIFSSPGFKPGGTFNPAFLVETISKYILGKLGIRQYIVMPMSKKKYPSPYENDPYRVGAVTANLMLEINWLQGKTAKNIKRFNMPVMMIRVSDDNVVSTQAQDEYYALIPSENKIMKSIDSFDHDWLPNPGAGKVFAEIIEFVKS